MAMILENRKQNTKDGFALLIAIIFMSVMLAFALALASLSYKQQVLASYAIQSQYAFYAADAALEYALYADQQETLFAYPGTEPLPSDPIPAVICSNSGPVSTNRTWNTSQWIIFNRISLDSGKRCADVTVYKGSSGATFIFSQGYNVPCATVANPNGARFVARGINALY
jgi:hypothetical protein